MLGCETLALPPFPSPDIGLIVLVIDLIKCILAECANSDMYTMYSYPSTDKAREDCLQTD